MAVHLAVREAIRAYQAGELGGVSAPSLAVGVLAQAWESVTAGQAAPAGSGLQQASAEVDGLADLAEAYIREAGPSIRQTMQARRPAHLTTPPMDA